MVNKIFGIGLSRTGTTSLTHALNTVGVNITHYPMSETKMFDTNSDGASDIPVIVYYKQLDKMFPGSKFVYTIREKEEWLDAMDRYLFVKRDRKMSEWQRQNRIAVYGQLEFDRDLFSEKYDAHDSDVKSYFKGREQDLLILNICGGDGCESILSFIDKPNDKRLKDFPHSNRLKV